MDIPRLIVPVIVDAIESKVVARARAYVRQKCFKIIYPFRGHSNSSPAVTVKRSIVRVVATVFGSSPRGVFFGAPTASRSSVLELRMRDRACVAPARTGFAGHEFISRYGFLSSATTRAQPRRFIVSLAQIGRNGEVMKCLAS